MIKTVKTTDGSTKAYYNGALVQFKRVQNDVYGNPLYKVYPVNFLWRKAYHAYKNYKPSYTHNGYYLLQSYNIATDVQTLLEEITEKVAFPPFDESLLENYADVRTLQDQEKEVL